MDATLERRSADPARHRGPSLVVVGAIYAALVLAAVIVPAAMAGGRQLPSPFDPDAWRWFAEHPAAALASSFLVFCSAVPLGIYTATASSRVQFLGMKVAGIHIALVGGTAASIALATSAFGLWALARPEVAGSADLARALQLFSFAAGDPGFAVPFGLFVAGISVVAGLQALVPRWLMAFGLAIAAVAEVSVLALVWPAAAILVPAARVSGLVWVIIVGALLPKSRGGGRRMARTAPPPTPLRA